MVIVDEAVLADPARLDAVRAARTALPALPLPLDGLVRLAARLLDAPVAQLTLVGRHDIHLAGGYGQPRPVDAEAARRVVSAGSLWHADERRSFAGAPVRDPAGRPVGALVLIDDPARCWTAEQIAALTEIAALARPGTEPHRSAEAEPPDSSRAASPSPVQAEATGPAAFPGGTQAFLAALVDSLPVGVVACGPEGEMLLVNRPVRELMNLPADGSLHDYPARAAAAFFDADGRPVPWSEAPLQRAARGERVVDTDLVVRLPGRRERIVAATAQPVVTADGRRLGAVAIAREVTALRRAERFRACQQAVERALQSARSAVEAAPGVLAAVGGTLGWAATELWLVDEDDGELGFGGRWCAPGSGLESVLGFAPIRNVGITGRVWATGKPIWVPDIADTVTLRSPLERSRAAECLRHGVRTVLAVPVRDGDTVLGVLTCYGNAPVPHEDLLALLLDGVAAQIGVYVALRRAEALARQLARAKDDFIALVSHEMRTPLTSIMANASMLADEQHGPDAESRAMVDAVLRNASSLRGVVDTLLDLAGLDSGHLTLTVERVDLAVIVADAIAAAGPHAAAHGVRLIAAHGEPLSLDGDAHRLRQVVDDLLANAVRYSPGGGDVHVGLRERPGVAELTVTDDGIGTPAEERDRVFDRFYRASNVRHQGIAGQGLGLSLARTIVELHGGTIRLAGHRPHGTTATVRLPRRRSDARRRPLR